jgi:uncharacterized phage protein (TIGR02220 family)
MFVIEQKYGNDGYAFWFKLLEMLGSAEGHYLNFENDMDWEFLIARTRLDKDKCSEMLDLLSILGAIDKELWEANKIVWSDNFVENIKDAYRNRTVEVPAKPSILRKKPVSNGINDNINPDNVSINPINDVRNPQTKLKEIKEKNNIPYTEILNYLNEKASKNYREVDSNKKWIQARWKEGYILEDFKKVIDNKVPKWKGTIDHDEHLRPETLFGNKFESYLNEKVITKNNNDWRLDDVN